MLRDFTLADVITLSNGALGTASVLFCLEFLVTGASTWLWSAFGVLPAAMVADYLDGKVARWRRKGSLLGAQLDSLADLVSFGVAPAVIAFAVGMRGGFDLAVLILFVGCGISRLARYNATAAELADESGKVRYYEGTPIPTSLALVAILAVLAGMGRTGASLPFGEIELLGAVWHPLSLMYLVSGGAMISKTLRIPKP